MVDFLVVGDTHADGIPSCIPSEIANVAVTSVLNQALSMAMNNRIDNIILMGDLFDGYPGSMQSHIEYLNFFSLCAKQNIKVFAIDGNHGVKHTAQTSLMLLKYIADNLYTNVHIFTQAPSVMKVEGATCVFLPWPHTKVKQEKPCLVFAHVPRPGVSLPNGYTLKDVKDFPLKNHFWVIGDIHEPQQGKRFVYPGAPLQLKFGDSANRHFLWLKYKRGEATFKKLPIIAPYILNVMEANEYNDLLVLKDRPLNEWTKVRLGPDILPQSNKITAQYERIVIEPIIKPKKVVEELTKESLKVVSNDWDFRQNLLKSRMKNEGMSKKQIDKAINIAHKIEKSVLNKL